MSPLPSRTAFEARKTQVISSLVEALDSERRDKSPKGFIDAPILDLIHIINRHPDYYTTSSCSGRIAIYCEGLENVSEKTTKGGKWLYVTHDPVDIPKDVDDGWILRLVFGTDYERVKLSQPKDRAADMITQKQLIYFKFEPLILHIEAASHEACMRMNHLAFQAGYQNSGITPSKARHMLAIRSTHKLDTPIAYVDASTGHIYCLVDPSYIHLLLCMSNEKFEQNMQRMKAFEAMIEKEIQERNTVSAGETKEERRERKRKEGMTRRKAALEQQEED